MITALLASAALAGLKYGVMPNVQFYEAQLQTRVSAATRMDVSAESIRGGWAGFSPFLEMTGVEFREPKGLKSPTRSTGDVALRLPIVRASLSIPYLAIGQLRFRELVVFQPQLLLVRGADGFIYFAGRPLNRKIDEPDDGRLIDWLLEQSGIEIHHARLTWRDDTTPAPELIFTDVGIRIDRNLGRHSIGLVATPPIALARQVEVRGRLRIAHSEASSPAGGAGGAPRWEVDGNVFTSVRDANLGELRRHLNVPDNWRDGVGSVRAWLDIDSHVGPAASAGNVAAVGTVAAASWADPVKSFTADVSIINAKAQLGEDVTPLAIAKLAGRLSYQQLEDGFSVASNKLEFRTKEGVISPPADFSLSLQHAGSPEKEKGEITANGIDLKVMTSLIEYFPIGPDLRQMAAKFGLRGAVKDARFAWTGTLQRPSTYQIKGSLIDFASNLNESIPGISGLSGSVDGTEKGGAYTLKSQALSIDMPSFVRKPIRFATAAGSGGWQVTDRDVTIKFDALKLVNSDMSAELNGQYARLRAAPGQELPVEKRPGALDITLKIAQASAVAVPFYLPQAASQTREYLEWAIRDGTVDSAVLAIKGQVYDFPYQNGHGGSFTVRANLKNIDFRYAEGWPIAEDINAEFLIDNTAIRAKITTAKIFNATIRKTDLLVPDSFAQPLMLSIVGEADARAEDVSRYLRESPLVDGIGAFTKVVSLEGPGKLNLNLKIPLSASGAAPTSKVAPKLQLSGRYSLSRGAAKLSFGTQISNLGGSIAFTESGVKSNGVSGVAFGAPIAVAVSGGGEAGVVTDFVGRADVQQLGDLLPFRMPLQVTGNTDVKGRITSARGGVDVQLDASMIGVASSLPSPLAKRVDEARPITLAMVNVGQQGEKIRFTMAGNASTSTPGTAFADSRIDARFQRRWDAAGQPQFQGLASVGVPVSDAVLADGLWLMGTIRSLDFDQWMRAADNFAPKAAAADVAPASAANNDSIIAGFDFSLDKLTAYSRPFSDLKIRGRKTSDRANPTWAVSVVSKEAEGDFTWRSSAYNERGAVRARLKRLVLSDEASAPAQPTAAEVVVTEQDLPALDIIADEFVVKDLWLGKLELKATPQTQNWRIDQLVIANGHARVDMDGLWQRYGDPFAAPRSGPVKSLTTMNIKVDSSNLNALFGQFGFGDQMRGGRGGLEGKLSWPGHAYEFQTVNLSGAFKVSAERGQFAKIEPGAGKLLGLMSLQSIPRRLSFDFRDLFSEGYAFDKIEGDITIADGVMFAKKFEISGPAADVRMTGDISLPSERVNLTMTVAPRLSTVAAVGAGVLVNPLVGLGVLLGGEVLKSPLERVLAAQYSVTGKWDNPEVERIGRTTTPVEPKPTAPPRAAEVPAIKAADTNLTDDRDKKNKP